MTRYFNPENLISQFLNDTGDGQANYNLVGNYGSPNIFKYVPPVGKIAHIDGITIFLAANGQFAFDQYVPGTSLTNGLTFRHYNGTDEKLIMPPRETFTTLGGMSLFGEGSATDIQQGNAINYAHLEITLSGLYLRPLDVNGSANESFEVILHDDFSGLINHFFLIHGNLEEV